MLLGLSFSVRNSNSLQTRGENKPGSWNSVRKARVDCIMHITFLCYKYVGLRLHIMGRNVRFACLQILLQILSLQRFAQICTRANFYSSLHTWQTTWQMWQWPRSRTSQINCAKISAKAINAWDLPIMS